MQNYAILLNYANYNNYKYNNCDYNKFLFYNMIAV